MLTSVEIEKKLFDQAELFDRHMRRKEYAKAKACYDNTRTVAVAIGLEDEKMTKLFGSRQVDPPIEGLFPENLVQKAYREYILRESKAEEAERQLKEMRRTSRADRLAAFREKMGQ